MENIIKELKGKNFKEGRNIIESNFKVDNSRLYSNVEDSRIDIYEYVEDNGNWICFTAPCEEAENDQPNIDYSNGYWTVSVDNEVTTELEIK